MTDEIRGDGEEEGAADGEGASADRRDADPPGADPPGADPPGADPAPRRRSHVVLWASVGIAAVVCALIAVMASAKPTSQQGASSPLIGKPAPAISGKSLSGRR